MVAGYGHIPSSSAQLLKAGSRTLFFTPSFYDTSFCFHYQQSRLPIIYYHQQGLVSRTVRAGGPQPAIEEIQGYFSMDRSGPLKRGTFFLRVKGDSMINAHIQEGDLALVQPQPTAENRDIVVALVDGEATLKRFYKDQGRIRLQAENPHTEPIIVRPGEGEVMIVGKVVGIFREIH